MATNFHHFFPSLHTAYRALPDEDNTSYMNKNQPMKTSEPFQFDKNTSIKARLAFRRQTALLANVAIYRLQHIDAQDFDALNPTERRIQTEQLERLFETLLNEVQLNGNTKQLDNLERCARLLIQLHKKSQLHHKQDPQAILNDCVAESERPAKYVALCILAPWIAKKMLALDRTVVETIQGTIHQADLINAERLNWSWSGGLDMAIMGMLNHHVGHINYANESLASFSMGTTYMSFVLGYFRLGLHLSLLVHGTLKGSWMDPWRTDADKKQNSNLSERFRTQWQLRKFTIINDALWATANLVCFMYLIGNNLLGFCGGGLASGLMFVDIGFVIWEYFEQETDHNALQERYKKEIQILQLKILNFENTKQQLEEKIRATQQKIELLRNNTTDHVSDNKKIELEHQLALLHQDYNNLNLDVLKAELNELQADQKQAEMNWNYVQKNLYNNLVYGIVLALSFGIISCAILSTPLGITAANALLLNLIGSAIACIATVAIHAQTTATEIEKSRDFIDQAVDVAHHEELIAYHQGAMLYKAISDVLIPAAVLSLLILAPSGLSLPILIPLVVVLFCIEAYIGQCKPEMAPMPEVHLDDEFNNKVFCS